MGDICAKLGGFDDLKKEIEELKETMALLDGIVKKLKEAREYVEQKLREFGIDPEKLKEGAKGYLEAYNSLDLNSMNGDDLLKNLGGFDPKLTKKLEELNGNVKEIEKLKQTFQSSFSKYQQMKDDLLSQFEGVRNQIEAVENMRDNILSKINKFEGSKDELIGQVQNLGEYKDQMVGKFQGVENATGMIRSSFSSLEQSRDYIEKRISEVEEEVGLNSGSYKDIKQKLNEAEEFTEKYGIRLGSVEELIAKGKKMTGGFF